MARSAAVAQDAQHWISEAPRQLQLDSQNKTPGKNRASLLDLQVAIRCDKKESG
jgi:hypothetical protein